MPVTWLDETSPFLKWEPLLGKQPCAELSRHPAEPEVVLRVQVWIQTSVERAAVWNSETRRLLWAPEQVNAMSWTPSGELILAVREHHKPGPHDRGISTTPFQSEFLHFCDLYEWPSRALVGSTELTFPTGWLTDIVPSPTETIACYVWMDQTEAGIEFLSWNAGGIVQLEDRGYYGSSNLVEGPVFSPDGRFVVLSYGEDVWWSDDREEPSAGGPRKAGWVTIVNVKTGEQREIDVVVQVEPGWKPADPEGVRCDQLSCPVFETPLTFAVTASNGVVARFSVADE